MADKAKSMHIADIIGCDKFRKGLEQPVTPVKPLSEPTGLYYAFKEIYGDENTPLATTNFRHGQKG